MEEKEDKTNNNDSDMKNIRVYVRVRPPLQREMQTPGRFQSCVQVNPSGKTLTLLTNPAKKTFLYDHVGGMESTQEELFSQVGAPISDMVLRGFNSTIFAYGQTGSGKTYSLQGPTTMHSQIDESYLPRSPDALDDRGLIPRVLSYIFDRAASSGASHLMQATFLEIYQQHVYDLLVTTSDSLNLREGKDGVYCEGVREAEVRSAADALRVLETGTLNRTVGETAMNRESSRSHSIFSLTVQATRTDPDTGVAVTTTARFNLVDLAGSERQRDTGATGTRLSEANAINTSLSALGNVIVSLVEISHGRARHIPYRDSKLTFLLKDSLGGNSLTYLVACVSPSLDSMGETLSTLKFAQRAKKIKNRAVLNEGVTGGAEALTRENARLRDALRALQAQLGLGSADGGRNTLSGPISRADMEAMAGAVGPAAAAGQPEGFEREILRRTLQREREARAALEKQAAELADATELAARLQKQVRSGQMVLSLRERALAQLKADLASVRAGDSAAPSAAEESLRAEVQRLEAELAAEREAASANAEVIAQHMEVRRLEDRAADLERRLAEEAAAKTAALEALEKSSADEASAADVRGLLRGMEAARTEESMLRFKLGEAQKHNFLLTEEIEAMLAGGSEAVQEKVNEEVLVMLESERQILAQRLEEAEAELEAERKRFHEMAAERDGAAAGDLVPRSELDQAEARADSLHKQLASSKGLNLQLKSFLEKAGERDKNMKQQLKQLQREVEEKEELARTLREKEQDATDTVQSLTSIILRQESETGALRADLEEALLLAKRGEAAVQEQFERDEAEVEREVSGGDGGGGGGGGGGGVMEEEAEEEEAEEEAAPPAEAATSSNPKTEEEKKDEPQETDDGNGSPAPLPQSSSNESVASEPRPLPPAPVPPPPRPPRPPSLGRRVGEADPVSDLGGQEPGAGGDDEEEDERRARSVAAAAAAISGAPPPGPLSRRMSAKALRMLGLSENEGAEALAEASAHRTQFGLALDKYESLRVDGYASPLPVVLVTLRERLFECGGAQKEGIFSVSRGSQATLAAKKELDTTGGRSISCSDPTVLAKTICMWFRELRQPLLEPVPLNSMVKCRTPRVAGKLVRKKLPEPQRTLLFWLLDVAVTVDRRSDENKMPLKALAPVISPNLLPSPNVALMTSAEESIILMRRVKQAGEFVLLLMQGRRDHEL